MRRAERQSSPLRIPRAAVLPAAALAGVVVSVLATWMRHHGLVTGSPAVLGLLTGLSLVAGTRVAQLAVGRGHLDTHPILRLTAAFVLVGAVTWTAGWSFLLPVTAVLVGFVQIRRSGSWTWVPALVIVSLVTVLGQIGVALGMVSTVARPSVSHVAAAALLLMTTAGLVVAGAAGAERERAQVRLERTEARLLALMESSEDVLTVSDAGGAFTYVSPAASRALGHEPADLVGTDLLELADIRHRPRVAEALETVVRSGSGARTSIDVLVTLASSEDRWFEWSVHNLLGDPLIKGLVIVQRDVTDRLRHQEALAYAAGHDDLTGLPNRSDLLSRITEAARQATPDAGLAVLFLDLDRFKEVNDRYGHAAGDEVLTSISRRLRAALRPDDHLARVSGDEFCALMTAVHDDDEVSAVVDRVHAVVSQPVHLAGGGLVSVGVSVGRALTFGPQSAETLFTSADASMYRDKRARRRAARSTSSPVRLSFAADRDPGGAPETLASARPAAGTTPA